MELNLNIHLDKKNYKIDNTFFQKMVFVFNALEEGWSIKKKDGSYTFSKKHENKKEVFHEDYLIKFMQEKFDIDKILS